jgi:E3 Ubiquitin ligase
MLAFLIFLLFAIVFLVAGGVLFYFRRKTQQKSALMEQTQTSDAANVLGLAPGTLIEVKGTLRCDSPLTSEMAGRSCAYYSARVTREYLERDYDDEDHGSDRRSETLAHNEGFAPFFVEDATGRVAIRGEEAEVDAEQVVERFERPAGEGSSISFGGATLQLGGGERTIGYRYTESILPVDAPVYVLGVLQENGEIGAPPSGSKEKRFVVSYRSEEALSQNFGRNVLWLGLGAAGAFVLSIVFLLIGIFVPMG